MSKMGAEYIKRQEALEECYYLKKRPAGDEVYYWCDLDDHPCSKEYNDEECEEYNDQIKEKEEENDAKKVLDDLG